MEAHLEVGKKWAEIAKRLKSRTENSVKNRWNSLMKKYKTDSDSDTLSSKSGYSDSSGMDDLEKKIANMIINEKKRELTYTNTPSRISEVPEEEYLSDNDDSLQTSTQISNNPFGEEEDKEESTTKTTGSVSKKKSGGIIDVNKSKNALRNLVREDIDIKQQQNTQKTIPPSQNPSYMNSSTNNVLFPQGITQIQGNPIFGNPQPSNQILGSTNGFLNFSKPPTSNNRPTPKQPVESSPGLFNRPGGNFNNQGAPMNNLFGMSGDMLNLNLLMMNQNNLNLYNSDNVQENSQNLQRSTGSLEYLTEIKPDEEKVFKFVEKTPETFNPNDFSGLHYAAVDVNQGFIYFLSPITKDNFPPPFTSNQVNTNNSLNQMKGNSNNKISSTGNVDFIMASPHLGSVNFSPNPFSNSNLISLVKNQFSPGMNFFQESPGMDPRFINPDQRINSWNNEWTPETPSRPITIDANKMKQANLVWGNQFHRSSPEQRMMLNNSALMARQQQQIFQMSQGMNMERQKKEENSPTVFLSDTNKNNNLLFQTKQLI